LPAARSLSAFREAAAHCQACGLWKNATQTVFGEGRRDAKVMFVGEQPGDKEDLAGKPFVGPAGQLLDEALAAAGIDRATIYVTNAVKHFKWRPAGKRRLHEKPNRSEIAACKLWREDEIWVIGTLPEVPASGGAEAGKAAREGAIQRFRESTRDERIQIAGEARERFRRNLAWGATIGGETALFTHLSVPVMTRLRLPE